MKAAQLTVLRNGQEIKSVPIEGEVSLGRADGNVIRLDDRAISRRHAVFKELADGIQVLKQSDLAPLRVNGAECTQAIVRNGDVIEIGPYLLRVRQETVAEVASPVATPVAEPIPSFEAPSTEQVVEAQAMEEQPISLESASEAVVVETAGVSDPIPGFEFQEPGASDESPALAVPFSEDGATQVASSAHVDARLVFKPGDANVTELSIGSQEISIGRGSTCSVVLNDKKSSRKHAIIRRAGVAFTIRDLDSANGVFVNGERIAASQDVELSGDALIQIGNIEFQLIATSKEYAQQAPTFEPVPEAPIPFEAAPLAPLAPLDALPTVAPEAPMGAVAEAQPLTGIGGGAGASSNRSLVAKFRALPPRTRILWILAIGAGLYFGIDEGIIPPELLGLSPQSSQKTQSTKPAPKPSANSGSTTSATFESLRPEQKQFVETQRRLAYDYFRNQDWDNALYAVESIFKLVPDYEDAREIQRYALQGKKKKEALEEERKRIEEEARIKTRVDGLVEETAILMESKQYEEAKEKFAEILSLDPDHPRIAEWKQQLEEFEEQKRIAAQRQAVLAEINSRARARLSDGLALTRKGRWYESIPIFREVLEMQPTDRAMIQAARGRIAAARSWIRARRDPLLAEAAQLEKEKQYAAAYKLYQQAAKVDPEHSAGPKGMRRIRSVLHAQSKALYTEAVLAESYSDFETAERKYRAVLDTAPEDDLYHERAQRKLARFVRFPASEERSDLEMR